MLNLSPEANTKKQTTKRQLENNKGHVYNMELGLFALAQSVKKSFPSDGFITPAKPQCRCSKAKGRCFLLLFRNLVLLSKPKSLCQHALSTLRGFADGAAEPL